MMKITCGALMRLGAVSYMLFCFCGLRLSAFAQSVTPQWGDWRAWGDQHDGTYRNPIIPADFSDIDCIRVGDEYYAISSTFQFSPGMTILRSYDLVNWTYAGHAVNDLTQIGPELDWSRMGRYGRGIWAGSLRYHGKRFYLAFGTPDEGLFITSAPRVEGPWQPLTPLLGEPGWDDCCMYWDDNGEAAFVATHFADGYKTYLFRMSPDGKSIDRASAVLVNEGNGREANKLIRHEGWYYLIFSEYKPGVGRYVMARRSRRLFGPYEEEKQLAYVCAEANEPNQGGIVEGKDGNWYFLTHHGSGDWSGRIMSLLPVSWREGWPIIGSIASGESMGRMVWGGRHPAPEAPKGGLLRSDEFAKDTLTGQWQWNYQPRRVMYSLSERPGWLRLKAFKPLKEGQVRYAGNTLTQRVYRTERNRVVVKLDISNVAEGQRCGLCHLSVPGAALGVVRLQGVCRMEYLTPSGGIKGEAIEGPYLWIASEWGLDGRASFSYSTDGGRFTAWGDTYTLTWGDYRGDRIGVYCFNDIAEEGFVDVDFFRYDF